MNGKKLIAVAVIIGVIVVVSVAFFRTQVAQPEFGRPGKGPQPSEEVQANETTGAAEEGGEGETMEAENLVEITSQRTFSPQEITVSVGERVYFLNNDDVKHTILIPSRAWEQELEPGGRSERPPVFYEAQRGSNTFKLKDDPEVTGIVTVE